MKSFIRKVALLFFFTVLFCFRGSSENSNVNPPAAFVPAQDPAQIIQFLSHTISWYRQLAVEQQLATQPSDLTFFQENHRVADQVVQLAFDYARSQAQLQTRKVTKPESQSSGSNQYQGLAQAAQKAEQQLQDTQSELESTRRKAAAAAGAKKKTLD